MADRDAVDCVPGGVDERIVRLDIGIMRKQEIRNRREFKLRVRGAAPGCER